ncbi:TPA: hypothetical protein N0F65_002760, partial [Lagenidium giganteum]
RGGSPRPLSPFPFRTPAPRPRVLALPCAPVEIPRQCQGHPTGSTEVLEQLRAANNPGRGVGALEECRQAQAPAPRA